MKNYQKIKGVLCALVLTIALLSFKTADAQVYAKLEAANPYSYSGPDGTTPTYPTRLFISYDYYLRFYSDAACTHPTTLPAGANVSASMDVIEYYDEVLWYGGTYTLTGTAGAGDTELYLGNVTQQDLYYDTYGTGWGLQTALGGVSITGATYVY